MQQTVLILMGTTSKGLLSYTPYSQGPDINQLHQLHKQLKEIG